MLSDKEWKPFYNAFIHAFKQTQNPSDAGNLPANADIALAHLSVSSGKTGKPFSKLHYFRTIKPGRFDLLWEATKNKIASSEDPDTQKWQGCFLYLDAKNLKTMYR
jgi:hypothetical protein